MSRSLSELAQRRAALLRRCAVQRLQLRYELAPIHARLAAIDRGLRLVQNLVTQPAVLVIGATVVLMLGRSRVLRLLGGALAVLATVRRLRRTGESLSQLFA